MTGWLGTTHKKPSDIMLEVLEGKLNHDDAPPAVQSILRLEYFNAAVEVCLKKSKEDRKKYLSRVPETCRSEVEAEVKRLWPIRDRIRRRK